MNQLEQRHLIDNTIIIFMSDNGACMHVLEERGNICAMAYHHRYILIPRDWSGQTPNTLPGDYPCVLAYCGPLPTPNHTLTVEP